MLLLLPAVALAQSAPEDRLPPDTSLYLLWRGGASTQAAQGVNSLLRLWADPEFIPGRNALLEKILADALKAYQPSSLTPAEMLSLLENPLLFGAVRAPSASAEGQAAQGEGEKSPQPVSTFLVYDATGKAELLQKLLKLAPADPKQAPTISSYTFAETSVEAAAGPKGTHYRALAGKYFLRSDRKETLEDLILRLRSADPPATSLPQVADYQKARQHMDDGATVEFFARVSDVSKISPPPARRFELSAFFSALHFERLEVLCGSLNFAGQATRARMALLGDTSPGSILDVAGVSSKTFATLDAAPTGAASYNVGRLDLSALYVTLRSALLASLQPQQASNIELFEALIGKQIGMGLGEALKLLGGEFASISFDPGVDPLADLYAATVQNPEGVLHLLRLLLATRITSEEREGDTTYLTLGTPYTDSKTGAQRRRFYTIGVTPQMLLAAPRKAAVREAAARLASAASAPASASLAADPRFLQARARLPESLSGLGYTDLARVQWDKLVEAFAKSGKENPQQAEPSTRPQPDWQKVLVPAVLTRHLHRAVGGWWKDRNGIYFDGYIE